MRGGVRGALGGRLSAQLAAASKELFVSKEPAANEHLALKITWRLECEQFSFSQQSENHKNRTILMLAL